MVYLCVVCGSENKQRLFPYTALTDWFVQVFNLKVDRQLSREYFTSDAIYNGSAGMTLYYYMCRELARLLQEREEPVLAIRIS